MSGDTHLTHIDEKGDVRMVDVSQKPDTERVAIAEGFISMHPETLALIVEGKAAKGDVLACARVAGVMAATQQRGCDLVLNCLSGRFMQESLRCLAPFGTFIEIGKTDAMERHAVGVHSFLDNGTYIFFDMDRYFAQRDVCVGWIQGMAQCVANGTLKPPPSEVYSLKNLSLAMRRLSAAKHIGKVVIQLREADGALLPSCRQLPFTPHRLLRADASYLVVGGTGGLGLCVSEWLAEHGARHLLLASRSGRVHEEDKLVLDRLTACGVDVELAAVDAADRAALERCLDGYRATHPPLRGVLHTAMVLRDGLIDSLSEEDIAVSLAAKTQAGWNVHAYCEAKKLALDLFVVFSSISAVVGNLGQSNYCVGNLGLEGLVYHRRAKGLPGCVLNLGGVYDAGAVARDGSILNASLREQMISKNDVLRALHVVAQRQSYLVDTPLQARAEDVSETPYQIIVFPFETGLKQLGDHPIFDSMKWSLASSSVQADALIMQMLQLPPTERRQAIGERVKGDLSAVLGVEGREGRPVAVVAGRGLDPGGGAEEQAGCTVEYEPAGVRADLRQDGGGPDRHHRHPRGQAVGTCQRCAHAERTEYVAECGGGVSEHSSQCQWWCE